MTSALAAPLPARPDSPRWALIFLAGLLLSAGPGFAQQPDFVVQGAHGVVASDSPAASKIGADVLSAGGNAFDAAVATSFALGVARPYSTGLGGGGFMVAYLASTKQVVVLDFRESAPKSATPTRYELLQRANRATGFSGSVYGPFAVGTPGQLRGIEAIHKRFGSKPWASLITPSAALAEVGVPIDSHFRDALKDMLDAHRKHPRVLAYAKPLRDRFAPDGKLPELGTLIPRPRLAATLRMLADQGASVFYTGEIALAISAASRNAVSLEDLRNYRPLGRQAIRATYGDYELLTMPPPSSGGIALAQTLNILTALREMRSTETSGPAEQMHLRVEALKHAFADRARYLGDTDFAEVPVETLLSPGYARVLAQRINPQQTNATESYGSRDLLPKDDDGAGEDQQRANARLLDDAGTSHFSIADKFGNVVCITETINGSFGSHIMLEKHGIILNNQLDDFLTVPGTTNLYGLTQSDANLIAPGKRPLSSMSPTIVLKDGEPVLALGGSGGPRIITSVLHVMLNVLDVELPLADAVESVRPHHQWLPDEINFDRPAEAGAEALQSYGHKISNEEKTGVVQVIQKQSDQSWIAASDPRKGGKPAAAKGE